MSKLCVPKRISISYFKLGSNYTQYQISTPLKTDLDQCWRTTLQLIPVDSSSKVASLRMLGNLCLIVHWFSVEFLKRFFLYIHVQWNIFVGWLKIFCWEFLTSLVGQGIVIPLGRSHYHFCGCRVHIPKKSKSHKIQVWELKIASPQRIPNSTTDSIQYYLCAILVTG